MKKFLLSIAIGALAVSSMLAGTDGQVYEQVGDYKLVNDWIISRVHTGELEFNKLPFANNYARRATIFNGEVLISQTCSPDYTVQINDTTAEMQCVIYRYSVKDGTYLGVTPLTLNGKAFSSNAQSSLMANNIGVDHFGHLWLCGYSSEQNNQITVYTIDITTGELTPAVTLEKGAIVARVDYIDVMGDITTEEEQCNIMAAGANSEIIYRWHCDQGGEWEPGFDGTDTYLIITQFPPGAKDAEGNTQEVTSWGFAPFLKMCLGEDEETLYNGDLFYVDGFYSAPALYDVTGNLYDFFDTETIDWSLHPEHGTNGITEFHLDGKNFMVYSIRQYQGDGHGCQANIVELDESLALSSMQKYWQIPADSLGHTSDSGIRIHCLEAINDVDEEGNEYVTILTYKCQNGFGIYRMGKNVKPYGDQPQPGIVGDINNDGQVDVTDVNIAIDIVLGKDSNDNYNGRADIDGNGMVDVSDVNKVIDIVLGK